MRKLSELPIEEQLTIKLAITRQKEKLQKQEIEDKIRIRNKATKAGIHFISGSRPVKVLPEVKNKFGY